jgi:hypothetical protein
MATWIVKLGWGWRDRAPPEVRQAFDSHTAPEKEVVFTVHADPHLVGYTTVDGSVLYGHDSARDGVLLSFEALTVFLDAFDRSDVDVVSLYFLNLKARTFRLSPRPNDGVVDLPDVHVGIREFSRKVAQSVHPQGDMWSSCEWAMLSLSRVEELQ